MFVKRVLSLALAAVMAGSAFAQEAGVREVSLEAPNKMARACGRECRVELGEATTRGVCPALTDRAQPHADPLSTA
jgi:hypothetical protein